MPADTSIHLISRTLGHSQQGEAQLVDEMIFSFTHTEEMPWMLPGISPTHRHVDIPLVVVVGFRDGKLAHERIYWDQASVLKQIGQLTDPSLLPQRSARRTDSLLGRGGRRAPESACYYWAVFQSPNRCDPGCRTQKRWNRAV
jgi:carboxymethylenebutenolidase